MVYLNLKFNEIFSQNLTSPSTEVIASERKFVYVGPGKKVVTRMFLGPFSNRRLFKYP